MGIDLHARAIADSQKIHNGRLGAGGFDVEMTFTNLSGVSQTIRGLYDDVAVTVDSETGQIITGAKLSISFHGLDLTMWNGTDSLQLWKVALTNGAGQDITAEIMQPLPNRSFGDVEVLCKIIGGHR